MLFSVIVLSLIPIIRVTLTQTTGPSPFFLMKNANSLSYIKWYAKDQSFNCVSNENGI